MPISSELGDRILRSVKHGFADQIKFTQDLVRFPSTRGNEQAIQDYMFRALRERGFVMDRFAMDHAQITSHPGGSNISDKHSSAPIVVGIHRPRQEKGRSLILQGHVDVVPSGPEDMWTTSPFDPVIKDGWMHGRGAADMKAGCASNIFALDALARLGLKPAATVYVQSVVEEESTGNGALMTHLRGYRAEAALIPEPMREELTRATVGVLWFELEVRGIPVHVAEMGTGANAIDAAYRVVGALRGLEKRWNAARPGLYEDIPHPINLNIGRIEGGDWASSVPAWCRIDALADGFLSNHPPKVTFNGFFAEGYVLAPGSEAEARLRKAHQVVTGGDLQSRVGTAYLDARVYTLYDRIPALTYGAVGENYHGCDERVNLDSVLRTTQAMALFIADWCGVEE
jgi:acetylornithine deacetylase